MSDFTTSLPRHAGHRESGSECPVCLQKVGLGDAVQTCRQCGAVHHDACWQRRGGCAAYECAPARRSEPSGDDAPLRISHEDLDNAVPLPSPTTAAAYVAASRTAPPVERVPRWNRLAVSALVCAVAGIPFFGIITGMVALVLGALAIGAIQRTKQKGMGLAITGIVLGLIDVGGWGALIYWVYTKDHDVEQMVASFNVEDIDLDRMTPEIRRAMRANALIVLPGGRFEGSSLGSGVILQIKDNRALILTNHHVVDPKFSKEHGEEDELDKPTVFVLGQRGERGTVVWLAPDKIDAAVIEVLCLSEKASDAKWQLDARPLVGADVFAIGNPHGQGWTHTKGSISQFRRREYGRREIGMIQTDAAINPGNSGGGLYTADGTLIGINTEMIDPKVANRIGFAVSLASLVELFPEKLNLQPTAHENQP